jgi:hypothetical protein
MFHLTMLSSVKVRTRDGQNNGKTTQYRYKTVCVGCTERTLVVSIFRYPFVCLQCEMPVSVHCRLFINSSYESTVKWEACQIFEEGRLLVRI